MEDIKVVTREEILEKCNVGQKIKAIIEEFNERKNPDKFYVPDKIFSK